MIFPDSFFEDEVREGFFVTSMMKRCWAAQLQVLEDVDTLCQKYNIKYYGDCGTLIGAVRHSGFIPWDDDLDICMLREDYELFLEHAHELPENYSILNWHERDDWNEAFARIVNTDRIRFDTEFMEYFHGFPYSAGLDIFILDYMYKDPELEEERRARAGMYMQVANMAQVKLDDECKELISSVEKICEVKIDYSKPVHKQLRKLAEDSITEVKRNDADKVCFMAAWIEYRSCFWDKKFCDRMMRVPFENTTIPIPVAYDPILKAHYGDYMKVNRTGGAHDYPCYSKQEKVLTEKYGWKSWDYKWNSQELSLGSRLREEKKQQTEAIVNKIQKIESMIASAPEIYGGLQAQVDMLKLNFGISGSGTDKDEVVFLTLGPEYWKNFSYFYKKEHEKAGTDVFVIPISYFDTAINGDVLKTHYITEGYDIPITLYNEYDLSKRHPKRIYIQCPYDYINPAMSVHSAFYSEELLKCTDELIYVPMYDIKEFNSDDAKSAYGLNFTAKTPVVLHADKIYLPTERLKEEYIKALISFSEGETDEAYWDTKITVEDYMKEYEAGTASHKEKKTILYYSNVAPMAIYGEKALEKIRSSLELLKASSDRLHVIWLISSNMKEVLDSPSCHGGSKLYARFINVVQCFKKEGWGMFSDDISDIDLDSVDAYAGNPSPYAHYLSYHKKPVMILKDFDD
ncbi:MAG: LicD family protein [Oribacterium sp.]|nr:LicD family protein [Oribacterium sp.]